MGSKYNFEPFDKWCIENIDEKFLEKYWDYERNICDPSKIGKGSRKEIWIKCKTAHYSRSKPQIKFLL